MNGELALAIALAAHGSVYLAATRESGPAELVGSNSTLQYVDSLVFHGSEDARPLQSAMEAIRRTELGRSQDLRSPHGTSAWFLDLRRAEASRLQIVKMSTRLDLPEVHASSFSGGILWAILAAYPSSLELWIPVWKHVGCSNKPWTVHVTGFAVTNSPVQVSLDLNAAAKSLRDGLNRARDFSTRTKLEWFPNNFSQALALLDSRSPGVPYHPDLLPTGGYSLLARQVIASAAAGWVFGGMGSFNDIWFEGTELNAEYKELLPGLYSSVVNALLTATNSFSRE